MKTLSFKGPSFKGALKSVRRAGVRLAGGLLPFLGVFLTGGCGNKEGTVQMIEQASTMAAPVDELYYFIYWISVISFVLIVGLMCWFAYKFHRSHGHEPVPTGHHTVLEIAWTFLPLLPLIGLFHWGFQDYVVNSIAPSDSVEIGVYGAQWSWTFEHPNGGTSVGNLVVPVDKPVKLIMTSQDVIHSFFVPAFRVKRDVVPGMYTSIWFEATDLSFTGPTSALTACDPAVADPCPRDRDSENYTTYGCRTNLDPSLPEDAPRGSFCYPALDVFCTEYCGAPEGSGNLGHSAMLGLVHVVTEDEYDVYLDTLLDMPDDCKQRESDEEKMACWGEILYAQGQCNTCHNVDGAANGPGPTFAGLWGRTEQLVSGTSITIEGDAGVEYIRQSILEPQAEIVSGYTNLQMPAQRLNNRQIDALIAYIKSIPESGREQ